MELLWKTADGNMSSAAWAGDEVDMRTPRLILTADIGYLSPGAVCGVCSISATQICHYSGETFCDDCFNGAQEHFIPGRILNNCNFEKAFVAARHLQILRALWTTYPIRLPSRLMKASRSFSRYASVKRKYLLLRQILRLRPPPRQDHGGSNASSVGSSCASSLEDDQFPCRHGDPFKRFERLTWVQPDENLFTMQEIVEASQSSHLTESLEQACLSVRKDLSTCCLRTRRVSIGDRCEDEMKCFACQSEHHICNRRFRKGRWGTNGQQLSLSLLSEPSFSIGQPPLAIPLGGIAARRAANDYLRLQDSANSWLRHVTSPAQTLRESYSRINLKTLAEFMAERPRKSF